MVERQGGDSRWDIAAVTAHLNAEPETAHDIRFGTGVRLPAESGDGSVLELYPQHSVVRFLTANLELALADIAPPSVRDAQIVLTQRPTDGSAYVAVLRRDGQLLLSPATQTGEVAPRRKAAPNEAANGEREARLEQAVRMLTEALERCGGDDPSCPDCGPARAFADSVLGERPAEQVQTSQLERQRRTVVGRVGAAPGFRTTRNGVTIARFPVAVHNDDGTTRWETVVLFGQRAERVRDVLQKGQQVEVIGYDHEREMQKRDGARKTVHELYGAVVRTR